jgi:hypothetical protein
MNSQGQKTFEEPKTKGDLKDREDIKRQEVLGENIKRRADDK